MWSVVPSLKIIIQEDTCIPMFIAALFTIVKFSSVTQWCPNLCDPMDCSTPGFPAHHHLPELAQTHLHQVGDAIQPSHPLSSPSSPAFSLSQHQGLFQWRLCNTLQMLHFLHSISQSLFRLVLVNKL